MSGGFRLKTGNLAALLKLSGLLWGGAYNGLMASLFVDNAWDEASDEGFASIDPATGERLREFRGGTAADVDRAVGAARRAFEPWAALAIEARIEYLNRFGELLKTEKGRPGGSLPTIISRETGKPLWESMTELDAMIGKLPLSIQAIRERRGPSVATNAGQTAATRYKPHGVVAVLGPFNFPGHLPNGHIVPALLAGNTVVFKPSELTPWVAERTVQLWQEAGLPAGVLNLVQGARETGQALASHPDIDGLFFTGSVGAGRALNKVLAEWPQKIMALEMGGNNPLVIWGAAEVEAAAILAIQSAFVTAGQRCSCARRLIVEDSPAGEAVVRRVAEMIPKIRVGAWTDRPEPYMGPLIRAEAAERAMGARGRLIELGGKAIVQMGRRGPASAFVTPGLIDVTGVDVPDEEIFAPLLQVVRVTTFDDAIAAANRTAFGLCAALVSDDAGLYQQFFRRARAGVINFNRPTTGASSALPFGGIGWSGNHRPSAYHAADYCSYPVASVEQPRATVPNVLPVGLEFR
jgi:succinylglutamic semialdehyde dehydrogenase